MPLLLDGEGRPLPNGQHKIKYCLNPHTLAAGALSSPWLTGDVAGNHVGATYNIVSDPSPANSIPHLLLTTAATTNRRAVVMGPAFNTSMVRCLRLDITAWGGALPTSSGTPRSVAMGWNNTPNGTGTNLARVYEASGEASSMPLLVTRNNVDTVPNHRTGRTWRSATIETDSILMQYGIEVNFYQNRVDFFVNDQNESGVQLAAETMPQGNLRPYAFLITQADVAATLKILQFDVTVEY